MSAPHVLHVIDSLQFGGAGRMAVEIVEPGDERALIHALEEVLTLEPHERAERTLFERCIAEREFDLANLKDQWLGVYELALGGAT